MTTAVEAKSLSQLTTLAFNPPSYPRNPTHRGHDPLVLYIAKVPGSRDVFLTPMKPRQKIVTAEDVQSSLYYLHFDNPEDELLKQEIDEERGVDGAQEPETQEPPTPTIPRKPVKPPRPSEDEAIVQPPPLVTRKPVAQRPGLAPRIDTANRDNMAAGVSRQPSAIPSHMARPRPQSQIYSPTSENLRPDAPNRRWSAQPPTSPGHPYGKPLPDVPPPSDYLEAGFATSPYQRERSVSNASSRYYSGNYLREPDDLYPPESDGSRSTGSRSPQVLDESSGNKISLTLIRRDPASGAQWNISKISDPAVYEVSSENTGSPPARKPGAPFYIDIENPGYNKFVLPQDRPPLPSRKSNLSIMTASSIYSTDPQSTRPQGNDSVFRRRMWLEGSRYAPETYGRNGMGSEDSGYNSFNASRQSMDTFSSGPRSPALPNYTDTHLAPGNRRSIAIPPQERKPGFRGYVFTSPWNGRCEFTTGGTGTSLKCKHILPINNAAMQSYQTVTVSELRFNLPVPPTSSRRAGAPSTSTEDSVASKRFSQRAHEVASNLAQMNLSLGQEFAGGGFGGKQAKLGKLIVHDEGLKMLDLIVATNMGLWWRAYERTERGGL